MMMDWRKLEITKSTMAFVRTELSEKEFLELEDVEKSFLLSKDKDFNKAYQ